MLRELLHYAHNLLEIVKKIHLFLKYLLRKKIAEEMFSYL